MDPTTQECLVIAHGGIPKLFEWIGIADSISEGILQRALATDFQRALGGPRLLRQLGGIPQTLLESTVQGLKVTTDSGESTCTPFEVGMLLSVGRVARRVCEVVAAEEVRRSASQATSVQRYQPEVSEASRGQSAAVSNGGAPSPGDAPAGRVSGSRKRRHSPGEKKRPKKERRRRRRRSSSSRTSSLERIRLSKYFDQGLTGKVVPLSDTEAARIKLQYERDVNDGVEVPPDKVASGEQLAALRYVVSHGRTPAPEFSVWRPHVGRLARATKYLGYTWTPEGYVEKELAGPPSFSEWERCWDVFAMAFVALGYGSAGRLRAYKAKVKHLDGELPGLWWLLADAEQRMRKERLPRLRLLVQEGEGAKPGTQLCPTKGPAHLWDLAFQRAAADADWWREHVLDEAFKFRTQLKTAKSILDGGFGTVSVATGSTAPVVTSTSPAASGAGAATTAARECDKTQELQRKIDAQKTELARLYTQSSRKGPEQSTTSQTGKAKGRHKKGALFIRNDDGLAPCFAYSRVPHGSRGGCREPCPSRFGHFCELCLGRHPNWECPQMPASPPTFMKKLVGRGGKRNL